MTAITETAPIQPDEAPDQPNTPETQNRRGRRIGRVATAVTVTAGLLAGGVYAVTQNSRKRVAPHEQAANRDTHGNKSGGHKVAQTIPSDTVTTAAGANPEAISGLRQPNHLPNYGEKVPDNLKEQLRQSSVKIWRQPKNSTSIQAREEWCDANIVNIKGQVLLTSAAHCFDLDYSTPNQDQTYPIQYSMQGSKGEVSATGIAHRLPYTFYVYNQGAKATDKPLEVIDGMAESTGINNNELLLMRTSTVTPELSARALPFKFDAPKEGQEVYFYGASRANNFNPAEAKLTYIGQSQQWDRQERLRNAVAAPGIDGLAGRPATSGGGGIDPEGNLQIARDIVSDNDSRVTDGDPGFNTENETKWRTDISVQSGVDPGKRDISQFVYIDERVVDAQLQILQR